MKKNNVRFLLNILVVVAVAGVCIGAAIIFKINSRNKSNLFAYALNLENEKWTYAPMGLDYGMTAEEVIKAERLKTYTWEEDGEILRAETTANNLSGDIQEVGFVKRYFFDSEGGLASVRYELTLDTAYEEAIRQLLYEQALAYMPETNRKTELQGLLDFENVILLGPWNEVVVWEDTVYEEDKSEVLKHANSDVVLRVGRPGVTLDDSEEEGYQRDVVVSLTVSRYEERLSQARINSMREQFPICEVKYSPLVNVISWTMEQYSWSAETFAYGQAVGGESIYDKKVFTGYKELDEKMESVGMSNTYEFGQYNMAVVEDSEGMFAADQYITSDYNRSLTEHELQWTDGMQIVVPASKYSDGEWYFQTSALYYVTEDGYVIASFDENKKCYAGYAVAESALSGLKLEDFMRKLKK